MMSTAQRRKALKQTETSHEIKDQVEARPAARKTKDLGEQEAVA